MCVLLPPESPTFMAVFPSKLSSSTYEWKMYTPFAEALNHALEQLSGIQVDGLPAFKTHIAFVPCNKGVSADHNLPGSLFKSEIAPMSIQDTYKFYEFDQVDVPNISQLINEIGGKSPSGSISWKTILSAVKIKRKNAVSCWPSLGAFDEQDTSQSGCGSVARRDSG